MSAPSREQTFDGHLVAGHVLLREQRAIGERTDARGGLVRGGSVVDPDHALAPRAVDRLQHRRIVQLGQCAVDHHERRLGHLRGRERTAHRRLVSGGRDRVGRVVWESEALAGGRGDQHAAVVDRDHGVDPAPVVEGRDEVGSGVGIVEWHHHRPFAGAAGEHRQLVGSDHDLDAEPGRGTDEIGRPVGRGRQKEEHSRHAPIMVAVSDLLTISPEAHQKVLEVRNAESEPETLALWIEVDGEANGAYTYLMEFRPTSDLAGDVLVEHDDDLAVAIPPESIELLRGATLAFNGGMVMQNPNRPLPPVARIAERPQADLSGEIPQRVIAVLEEQINPAIASHGGYAELVAVEDSIAYLRMGGGCQGCGMAAVTLTQGIEVAILDLVPEITEVVDVTDHASGANPYYEAAKK